MQLKTYLPFLLGALSCRPVVGCDDPDLDEPPSAPNITEVSFSGNGCPSGSVIGDLESGGDVILSNFSAGITSNPTDRTKNCQAHISFGSNPTGWQLSADNVTLRGYAVVEKGATAVFFLTTFWSQDASQTETTQEQLTNTDDLPKTEFVDAILPVNNMWSPCNANGILNVNVRVSFTTQTKADNSTQAYGYFGKYEIPETNTTYPVTEAINFKWRKCNATAALWTKQKTLRRARIG